MKIGDISDPLSKSQDGTQAAYRLIKLNNKIDEHKANVVDDFDLLKEYALANKKQNVLEKWVTDNIKDTYINLSKGYQFALVIINGQNRYDNTQMLS